MVIGLMFKFESSPNWKRGIPQFKQWIESSFAPKG